MKPPWDPRTHCRHPDCKDTNWWGVGRVHIRSEGMCPPDPTGIYLAWMSKDDPPHVHRELHSTEQPGLVVCGDCAEVLETPAPMAQLVPLTSQEYQLLRTLMSKVFDMDRMLHPGENHPDALRSLNTKIELATRIPAFTISEEQHPSEFP